MLSIRKRASTCASVAASLEGLPSSGCLCSDASLRLLILSLLDFCVFQHRVSVLSEHATEEFSPDLNINICRHGLGIDLNHFLHHLQRTCAQQKVFLVGELSMRLILPNGQFSLPLAESLAQFLKNHNLVRY